ncbi:hypothetical protein AB0I10_15600 [Streptomyces sp. NPDC050636]
MRGTSQNRDVPFWVRIRLTRRQLRHAFAKYGRSSAVSFGHRAG